jgi:hypothetical protein
MSVINTTGSSKLLQWLTACAVACVAGIASASVLNINGDTTGDPTWNRPIAGIPPTNLSGVGTNVAYEVNAFQVTGNGLYDFMVNSAFDNYLFVYQTAFIPTAQFTNILAGNDDAGGTLNASLTGLSLSVGTQYFFVVSGFSNTDAGAYTASITGAGNNAAFLSNTNPPVVPLPSTAALVALALSALTFARRRGS